MDVPAVIISQGFGFAAKILFLGENLRLEFWEERDLVDQPPSDGVRRMISKE